MTVAARTTEADRARQDVEELVRRAQDGCEASFAALVRMFTGSLYNFVLARGLRPHEAEDVVQETFIRAYRALGRYDARYAFSTWLFTIGRRCAVSHRRARRDAVPLEQVEQDIACAGGDADIDDGPGGIWRRASSLLSPKHYQALWLRYGEDMSVAEISRVMGISRLHARVVLHRARARLAERLAEEPAAGPVLRLEGEG